MPPAGFDLTISAGDRPQTYAVDRTATETAECTVLQYIAIYCNIAHFVCYCFVALRPNAGYGLLIHEVFRSHTTTHHIR